MEIIFLVEIVPVVIPATEIGSGSWQPFALPEGLQQSIFVEPQEQFMVLIELSAEWPIEELNL
jgi:hypothetical protein